jgi:hypothetical protein
MTDLQINSTLVSTLGFHLKSVDENIALGAPRKQGSAKEDFSSNNVFLSNYYEESPEPVFEIFGKFTSISAAETALYTLYGLLVQTGEHTFTHTDGTNTIAWKGIMKKAAVDYKLAGSGMFYSVKITTIKTNNV